ncbi:MAG: ParB/RepB/Spo0J family partition protein [Pseudomonadota bacterium]
MPDVKARPAMRRGLSALMADVGVDAQDVRSSTASERSLPIERLHPNPDQPRRRFAEEDLSDLASSIAQKGIIQPLIVRKSERQADQFEIVAGERRWRAAQRSGLHEVPVIVRDFSDTEVLEVAIIENIQRADLNPVEEALGFRQLMDRFGHTQEQLSTVLGKSRSHIANLMRLLKLPDDVQDMLQDGRLSAGHARALINAEDPVGLAKRVVAGGLSVRETERLVRSSARSETSTQPQSGKSTKDADTRALEGDLAMALGLGVSIDHTTGGGGKVTLSYGSLEQLDRLCELLSGGLRE